MAIETSVKIRAVVEGIRAAQSQFEKLGKSFDKIGKSLSLGLTAPIAAFGVAGIRAFDQQAKAIAQVEAGLRSTGNQVGRTSQELQALASDLQNTSLFGDEEILQGVTAQLLTFTNIANEQFDQTQQAAIDLAARLGGDLQSASIQLGKALNDPAKNLSALSRSGIQFSEDQIKVIKELQETNRLAEAQTIILGELEKQYGGSAQAAAQAGLGPFKQLQNSIGDLSEEFGAIIANAILPFVKSLQSLVSEFKRFSPETQKTIVTIIGLTAAIGPALIVLGKLSTGLAFALKTFKLLRVAIVLTATSIKGALISTGIGALVIALGFAVAKLIEMRSTLGSFSNVFQVIQLQVRRFGLSLKKSFDESANAAANFLRRLTGRQEVRAQTDAIAADIQSIEDKIAFITNQAKDAAQAEARDPANAITFDGQIDAGSVLNDIQVKTPQIQAQAKPIEIPAKITLDQELATSNSILDGAQAANQGALLDAQLAGASEESINQIRLQGLQDYRATLQLVLEDQLSLNNAQSDPRITDSVNRIKQGLLETDAEIKKLNESVTETPNQFQGAADAFASFAQQAANGLQTITGSALSGVSNALTDIVTGTKDAATAFKDLANSVIQDLVRIGIQKAIVAAIGSIGGGTAAAADGGIATSGVAANGGLARFNSGGPVKGPGGPRSDSILARLSNGEFVVRASSVQDLGVPFLSAINRMGSKGLSEFLKGNISNNLSAARNKSSRVKMTRGLRAFQDGGLVENDTQPQQQMPNLTINIENRSNARVQAIQPEGPTIQDQVRGLVYNIILEDAAVNGPLTRASGSGV